MRAQLRLQLFLLRGRTRAKRDQARDWWEERRYQKICGEHLRLHVLFGGARLWLAIVIVRLLFEAGQLANQLSASADLAAVPSMLRRRLFASDVKVSAEMRFSTRPCGLWVLNH